MGAVDFMVRADTQEFKMALNTIQTEETKVVNRRPRSLTTLKLEVLAERVRKMKRIREALANGTYNVQPDQVAKSLIKVFTKDDLK